MFMIKVIQIFMEIILCFHCFSEKTCWKMLFNILFSVSIFDAMFLFWFVGGCCLVAIAWSRTRLQMSTKKRLKSKLEELFSASSFGVCLYIKSDLHKILDNFYLSSFHMEETTSYDNTGGDITFPKITFRVVLLKRNYSISPSSQSGFSNIITKCESSFFSNWI